LLRQRHSGEGEARRSEHLLPLRRRERRQGAQVLAEEDGRLTTPQIPFRQTEILSGTLRHIARVQLRVREPCDLDEILQRQETMLSPGCDPAREQAVRDLLEAIVVETGASELQPCGPTTWAPGDRPRAARPLGGAFAGRVATGSGWSLL